MKNYNHLLRTILVAGAAATMAVAQNSQTSTPGARGNNTGNQSGSTVNRGTGTTGTAGTAGTATTTGSGNMTSADHQGHVAGAGGNAGSGAAMVGKADHQFMMNAAMGGMTEVQLAQMAQQKASSQEVKDYAHRLEQDHSKANDQLKAIAQQREVSLPTDIGEKHKAMVTKLNGMSGPEFDRAYINMMVQDHRKDVKEFERESNRAMDSEVKNFASSTLPTLKEHLQMAEQLQNSTRSRKADKATSNSSSSSSSSSTNPTSK